MMTPKVRNGEKDIMIRFHHFSREGFCSWHTRLIRRSEDIVDMHYGSGAGDFEDETHLKRGFPSGTSAAGSNSPSLSQGPVGQSIHYIPQYNIYDNYDRYRTPHLRQAGASQAKSDDSSSQTSEHTGLREVLTKNLLGNKKKKSKKDEPVPIIHIEKVVINPAPSKQLGMYGIYGDPVYSPYPRESTTKPPDPCFDPYVRARDYDSVPGYLGKKKQTNKQYKTKQKDFSWIFNMYSEFIVKVRDQWCIIKRIIYTVKVSEFFLYLDIHVHTFLHVLHQEVIPQTLIQQELPWSKDLYPMLPMRTTSVKRQDSMTMCR